MENFWLRLIGLSATARQAVGDMTVPLETSVSESKAPADQAREFDVQKVRADFPILNQQVNGKPLVYLDNAATTQKPVAVIDAIDTYYRTYNANIHRGVHKLSQLGTQAYEEARGKTQRYINAASTREVIFVRGTTEGINLVAGSWGRENLKAGDEVVVTHMEHHSNIVPWQMLCQQTGAVLRLYRSTIRESLTWANTKSY